MAETKHDLKCPHCGQMLSPFGLPESGGWELPFQLACFNDECSYYSRGWGWMFERFGVRASYRYRVDPVSGQASPLPVWSPTALRDRILDDDTLENILSTQDVIPEQNC
ncbi:MAG: hypothetical protein AB1714_19445 [Acidobacteriota bacterium]